MLSGSHLPLSKDFYTLDPICPATDIEPQHEAVLGAIAMRAYIATGCRDYARVDMRLAEDGTPYVLEVNPNPDLTDGSAFVMCAEASGRSYTQTLGEIVELALERATAPASLRDGSPSSSNKDKNLPTDHLHRKYALLDKPSSVPLAKRGDVDVETS